MIVARLRIPRGRHGLDRLAGRAASRPAESASTDLATAADKAPTPALRALAQALGLPVIGDRRPSASRAEPDARPSPAASRTASRHRQRRRGRGAGRRRPRRAAVVSRASPRRDGTATAALAEGDHP